MMAFKLLLFVIITTATAIPTDIPPRCRVKYVKYPLRCNGNKLSDRDIRAVITNVNGQKQKKVNGHEWASNHLPMNCIRIHNSTIWPLQNHVADVLEKFVNALQPSVLHFLAVMKCKEH